MTINYLDQDIPGGTQWNFHQIQECLVPKLPRHVFVRILAQLFHYPSLSSSSDFFLKVVHDSVFGARKP